MAGKCKESLTNGDLCSETDADSTSRRLSFLKMVGKGKMKRESMQDHSSQGPEEEPVEEVPEVKPREPLSVLEILQLVTKRDLFLADTHILELEQECREAESPTAGGTEDFSSPSNKDSSRRKAKDVELLYEALQKELWDVVKESLRSPTAGPNLGLVVQVLQQEEQADRDWAQSEGSAPGGPRPRELKKRWREAVVELADANLPQHAEAQAGELAAYLDKLRVRMVEDLGAARRNVVSLYPAEYDSFQVYTQSYHQAITRRLQAITDGDLQITDIYSLLDWLYNIYNSLSKSITVLEILQLVTKRDLFLADTHILELEQECREAESPTAGGTEDFSSPSNKDSSRRKAKDVELLYEALQKELWDVVKESLRSPTAGPNLGLVVQVLQQEEQADRDWAQSEGSAPGGPRPRELKKRWREAVVELADANLPQHAEAQAGELAAYLDKLRVRMVEDLGAARRNVVSLYPAEYDSFQVYTQSYHQAITRRLQAITDGDLQITDIYSLLDWLYNIYNRDVLGTVTITTPINLSQLGPLLPAETVEKLELDCLNSVRGKVTNELSQVLEEEEKRWLDTLNVEEYQMPLARTVIQRLQEDLERSAAVNRDLGSRVAQCSLNGLADFLYSFQRKVEMFHEMLVNNCGENEDGYIAKTIALVNCCPSFKSFVERCSQCDPSTSEDSIRRANTSLDRIINLSVRVLNDRLFEHIRPFFDKLIKRKWLSNTEPFDQIEALIKEHFKKFRRMDNPPYEVLVVEVHRRVMTEYVRAIMRGRIICTSLKMRKRMAGRLRDEGKHLKTLFKELESSASWLDSAIPHLSEIILLEDTPSIQMEVGVLVREFPDIRRKHVSAILNIRGMTRQTERQEILNIVKDIENSDSVTRVSRDRALFAEVPVTSEVHCLNVGLSRVALTASSLFSSMRRRRRRTPTRENQDDML
ncbi:tumor necrosis factor alpha-induced 2-like protein [Labeo rohita]|uniref:Tumor necrosis factor alpha-induced 2-like protein n=1 Tax=Labeo rohita TaxID=84645 RepID=A0A498LI06_LABRO|nr:tumor necrosis factor alpha-induced 2-like protein [Labeo rohita]